MIRPLFAGLALAALAACGAQTRLARPEGAAVPAVPYGETASPDADTLLALDPQAAPERSVELRRDSEERADDPFDLPPEE